jgi:hypothetical protein
MNQLTDPQRRVLREIAAAEPQGVLARGGIKDGVAERLREAGLVRLNERKAAEDDRWRSRIWTWHVTDAGRAMVEAL